MPREFPIRVKWQGNPGKWWGVGYDPKGQICMVRLDSSVSVQCREKDLELIE